MRSVLITNMYAQLGGGELYLLDYIRYLREKGIQVYFVLLEHGPLCSEAKALGASVNELIFTWQGNKFRSLGLLFHRVLDFYIFLKRKRPDLVIANTFNDFVIAGLAARFAGYPLLYRAQGELYPPERRSGDTWLGKLLIPFIKFAHPRIVCTTKREAEAMKKAGIPADFVGVVYNGTKDATGGPGHLNYDTEIPEKKNVPLLGIFGRLARWKGQDVFLRALAILKQRNVSFEAWVVGESSFGDGEKYMEELHKIIEESGIRDMVKFLGFRRDISRLMQACDIVCHCSRFEPFGNVVIEAMMAGRPVIASNVSGPQESVLDGVTGFLIRPEDPEALADAIIRLFSDPRLRAKMGRAGRERAQRLFNLENNLALLNAECERTKSQFKKKVF